MQLLRVIALVAVLLAHLGTSEAAAFRADGNKASKDALIQKLRESIHWDSTRKNSMDRVFTPWAKAQQAKLVEGGLTCASCQNYMLVVIAVAKDNRKLSEAQAELIEGCKDKYTNAADRDQCIGTVLYVVSILPSTLKKLADKNWNVPFNLCAILFDNVCTQDCCTSPYTPEQVYISLDGSNDFSKMRVTWVTLKEGLNSTVVFGPIGGAQQAIVTEPTRTYTAAGWIGTINTAVMTELTPDTHYSYSVGSDHNRSQTFTFRTFPTNIGTDERPLRIISIADMTFAGRSDWTVKRVAERVQKGEIDLVIHNGDISYADAYMLHWDMFMRKVSPAFAPFVPYMTTPGNHEIDFNFTAYQARLAKSMPRDATALEGALYYSLNIGPARILMMNSETDSGTADIPESEVAWAQAQLSSQDRKAQPWSVVFHHRPLYCNEDSIDCKSNAFLLRLQAESTYINNKVDLVGSGHVHYFIRSYPVAAGSVVSTNYTNPGAPVYSVNGAAGCPGQNTVPNGQDSLFPGQTKEVGYAIIAISANMQTNVHTLNHKFYEAVGDTMLDDFTITKST